MQDIHIQHLYGIISHEVCSTTIIYVNHRNLCVCRTIPCANSTSTGNVNSTT